MNYEEFLVALTDTTPKKACSILRKKPNHKYKKGYELIISKDSFYSYWYAYNVIKNRFELGENSISKDAAWSFYYAQSVIKGRFKSGENVISKNVTYSYLYARNVIKGRFIKAEKVIRNSIYKKDYAINIMKDLNFWEET